MLETKSTITEIKNLFDGFISRLDVAKKRISELEEILVKFSQTKKQREKKERKSNRISKNCGTKGVTRTY